VLPGRVVWLKWALEPFLELELMEKYFVPVGRFRVLGRHYLFDPGMPLFDAAFDLRQ
jgi:hypothetical protein